MALRSLKKMVGYKIVAVDGEIGKVDDFYIDDINWKVRYIVDKTGVWLFGRQVLISTASFKNPDWEGEKFPVSITKEQVENSPPIEADKPVSKENEQKLDDYFGWPVYWGGGGTAGVGVGAGGAVAGAGYAGAGAPYPLAVAGPMDNDEDVKDEGLRSSDEVTGYEIVSGGESVGSVDDFIVDDEDWAIRYLVLDTQKFLDGKQKMISTEWVHGIIWKQKQVSVDIPKEKILESPEFDASAPINREYEELIHNFYGGSKHWEK